MLTWDQRCVLAGANDAPRDQLGLYPINVLQTLFLIKKLSVMGDLVPAVHALS